MENILEPKEAMQKLDHLIQGIRVVMLTTIDEEGCLKSRPMGTQGGVENGMLWFFTYAHTAKLDEISDVHQVNLAYVDSADHRYVSVSGRAFSKKDPELKKKFWNPMLSAWFPHGVEDPSVVLLRVEPEHAEYWDSHQSKMVQFYKIAKAAIQEKRVDPQELGDQGKLDLTG